MTSDDRATDPDDEIRRQQRRDVKKWHDVAVKRYMKQLQEIFDLRLQQNPPPGPEIILHAIAGAMAVVLASGTETFAPKDNPALATAQHKSALAQFLRIFAMTMNTLGRSVEVRETIRYLNEDAAEILGEPPPAERKRPH